MPILKDEYQPNFINKCALVNAISSSVFRKTDLPNFVEKKHETNDNDFFVTHYIENKCKKLIILLPGLMGNYKSNYVKGIVPKIVSKKYDACVLNARSTTEPNRKAASFHAAFYNDLMQLLYEFEATKKYEKIFLIGFSMGGSITLNYLCREFKNINHLVKKAAVVSTPILIEPGATLLAKPKNKLVMAYMYKKIRKAAQQKKQMLIDEGFKYNEIMKATTFKQIDDLVTAKAFGFKNAEDYWNFASVKKYLPNLNTPTYLLNAFDDPMLDENSLPFDVAKQNKNLFFEATKFGGHMGFNSKNGLYFEDKILEFFEERKI